MHILCSSVLSPQESPSLSLWSLSPLLPPFQSSIGLHDHFTLTPDARVCLTLRGMDGGREGEEGRVQTVREGERRVIEGGHRMCDTHWSRPLMACLVGSEISHCSFLRLLVILLEAWLFQQPCLTLFDEFLSFNILFCSERCSPFPSLLVPPTSINPLSPSSSSLREWSDSHSIGCHNSILRLIDPCSLLSLFRRYHHSRGREKEREREEEVKGRYRISYTSVSTFPDDDEVLSSLHLLSSSSKNNS